MTHGWAWPFKGHLKESVSPRGLPENAQHHSNSPNKQQGQYRYRYVFRWCLVRNIVLSLPFWRNAISTWMLWQWTGNPSRVMRSHLSLPSTAMVAAPLSLLIEQPVLIPTTRHLLKDPSDPRRIHPMFPRLHLAVFYISGDSTKQWEFLKTLLRYSFRHHVPPHEKRTDPLWDAGAASVIKETLILFRHP